MSDVLMRLASFMIYNSVALFWIKTERLYAYPSTYVHQCTPLDLLRQLSSAKCKVRLFVPAANTSIEIQVQAEEAEKLQTKSHSHRDSKNL